MPILLLILLLGTLLFMWLSRRNSTLTRACRWRLDRTAGSNHYRCTACNAEMDTQGKEPRDCLRTRR
ncbi:hypothetical protein ACEN2J_04295 [Pseudorhodobacter sp. W20_MBD10_FR17]|uniref:hypothetical protein n=1 Tax=Pseudorhodobacter sp. W20_MBD10_FR17 TaxID=3240266 RepID=UPI003F985E0D